MSNSSVSYRPLEGKVAIVTGASRGIGAGVARKLASRGAKLILVYKSPSSTQLTKDLASNLTEAYGVQHIVIQADTGSLTGPEDIIKTAVSTIPDLKIDIIINNAGIHAGDLIERCTPEDFERIYAVNVRGPLLLVKAALPYLPQDRSGRIVNLSSITATAGITGQSLYGGTKAALDAMTRTWARELANRATVNSINPGPVSTDMWNSTPPEWVPSELKALIAMAPVGQIKEGIDDESVKGYVGIPNSRPARVEEIAGIVDMIVTGESGWCTGQVICANGGMLMSV